MCKAGYNFHPQRLLINLEKVCEIQCWQTERWKSIVITLQRLTRRVCAETVPGRTLHQGGEMFEVVLRVLSKG